MNWYRLIKLAAADTKIKAFDIVAPLAKAFVYKYEQIIPWKNFKSPDDFNSYLGELADKYWNEIGEIDNEETKTVLKSWHTLTIGGFGVRTISSLAFFCMIMKPLLDWAKSHEAPPPAPSAEAIKSVMEKISASPERPVNILKEYASSIHGEPKEDGWHTFKRGDEEKLYSFTQGTGWCTGSKLDYAYSYLENKTIHVYVAGGMPVAAVVVYNDGNDLYEVRGRYNNIPFQYRNEINDLMQKLGVQDGHLAYTFKIMNGIPQINDTLEKYDPESEEAKNTYALYSSIIQESYDAFLYLSKKAQSNSYILNITRENVLEDIESDVVVYYNQYLPSLLKKIFFNDIVNRLNNKIQTRRDYYFNFRQLPEHLSSKLNIPKMAENAWDQHVKYYNFANLFDPRYGISKWAKYISNEKLVDSFLKCFDNMVGTSTPEFAFEYLETHALPTLGRQRFDEVMQITKKRIEEQSTQTSQQNNH